jgi:hypothetical protein
MVRTLQRNPRVRATDTNVYKTIAGRHTPDTCGGLNGYRASTHVIQQWRTIMNKSMKMILAGAAIIAMSAGAYARGGEDCGYGGHGGMMGWDSAKMEKYHEQHLAKLHDKLKLTAQQEPAWKKFTANNPMADKAARPDPAEMQKLKRTGTHEDDGNQNDRTSGCAEGILCNVDARTAKDIRRANADVRRPWRARAASRQVKPGQVKPGISLERRAQSRSDCARLFSPE